MDIKNFIRKRLKKDNSHFVIRVYDTGVLYVSKKMNLTELSKYLKNNEKHIERVDIRLTLN